MRCEDVLRVLGGCGVRMCCMTLVGVVRLLCDLGMCDVLCDPGGCGVRMCCVTLVGVV